MLVVLIATVRKDRGDEKRRPDMDVSKLVGGSAQALEAAAASRSGSTARSTARGSAKSAEIDVVTTSGGAGNVAALTEKARALPDVREDVVNAFRELLGRGVLDTPEAASRAARGLLGG